MPFNNNAPCGHVSNLWIFSPVSLITPYQSWCSRSPVWYSPCSRLPAAVWAEQLRSPAGRWPAQSHSSCWPEIPSCWGTDNDVKTQKSNLCFQHVALWATYLDSSSRNLAPPASWSFLRCQFISWICFLWNNKLKWYCLMTLMKKNVDDRSPEFLQFLLCQLNHHGQVTAGGKQNSMLSFFGLDLPPGYSLWEKAAVTYSL